MTTSDGASRTLDHVGPEAGDGNVGVPALVCAYADARAVSLAALGGVLGRRTLREQGVHDAEISTHHADIVAQGAGYALADHGSRNGTFLDGRRLGDGERVTLVDGAIVRAGRSVFVYRERLTGSTAPSPSLGQLIAPFGLRDVACGVAALEQRPSPFVLIEGETGTGKELLARHVANTLGRAEPYAAVNVAGIAEGVFEAQLFGHVAGAFSDARTSSPGILVAHEGGAVFLDELGSLPLSLQSTLLRLLDQREVLAVGATKARTVDVLLIAATNGGLESAVAEGRFRADLLARLNIARLELPPLRERPEDLVAVAQHLAARHRLELPPEHVEVEAIERMMLHDWPRNVRELEALLRQCATLDPRPGLRLWSVNRVLGSEPAPRAGLLTGARVAEALAAEAGNETAAARRLGVTRGKLRRYLSKKDPSS